MVRLTDFWLCGALPGGGDASYNQKALQYYRGLVATWEGWRNGGYQPYMHTQQIYVCCFLREKAYGGPITSRVLHISTQAVISSLTVVAEGFTLCLHSQEVRGSIPGPGPWLWWFPSNSIGGYQGAWLSPLTCILLEYSPCGAPVW